MLEKLLILKCRFYYSGIVRPVDQEMMTIGKNSLLNSDIQEEGTCHGGKHHCQLRGRESEKKMWQEPLLFPREGKGKAG